MKQYETYKDSGEEWIGEIPEHWTLTKIKNISKIYGRIGFRGYTVQDIVEKDKGVISLSPSNIKNQKLDVEKGTYISLEKYEESPEIKIFNEDVIFVKTASVGKVCFVENLLEEATLNPQLIVFKEIKCNNKFLYFVLVSELMNFQIKRDLVGGVIPTLSQSVINNYYLSIPSLKEQTQIANYLNHKTAQLDTLIAKKEQLISLLQEERTAMINKAVTKGLDPNVPMKYSGIEWLGEIPAHWEAKSMKYVTVLKSGENITSEKIKTKGCFAVYGGNGIRGYYSEYTNEGNYILIGRQGALCGNIKYASGKFWASEHAIVCYLHNNYNWIWFGKLLEAMDLNQYNQSAAQPGLAIGLIKNLKIPSLNFEEQLKIVDFINDYEINTDKLINKYFEEINLLKEYKTALISEVVTGKVDIREEVLN
ncbi:restriction endonuclease subunit S [Tenacibaculum retecalamus]|uniref:restriction endonuclease subunit S n=1 Tax=Tenacibaculum retecalamus TaxID=3018315 RepID=UPI0023D8E3E5|nr:restriction endonuclease subunit S [Tenacibaculum retecalamus]WBX70876.1 restriction endonuclease subunit S [Tenacibaculum retecalamus]